MGKPLRVAVYASLSAIGSDSRSVPTRSASNGSIKCFTRVKCSSDFKPTCVVRRTPHRSPMLGKTNLLAASHNHIQNLPTTSSVKPAADIVKKGSLPSSSAAQKRLELPAFRIVGRMEPLRATPRLTDEVCTDEVYLKRHEKYERQEKTVKRRDRKWQREEQYRLHLMKISKQETPATPKIYEIEVVSKRPKTRKH